MLIFVFFVIVKINVWYGIMNLKIVNVLKSIYVCIIFIWCCIMEKYVKISIVFFIWIYILFNCRLVLMKIIIWIYNKNFVYRKIFVVFIVKNGIVFYFFLFFNEMFYMRRKFLGGKKKYWYIYVYMYFIYLYFWGLMFLDFY